MMNNYDLKIEKLKSDFEKGVISVYSLSEEEQKLLIKIYNSEIKSNKKEIEETKYKIANLKKKIDNIV